MILSKDVNCEEWLGEEEEKNRKKVELFCSGNREASLGKSQESEGKEGGDLRTTPCACGCRKRIKVRPLSK